MSDRTSPTAGPATWSDLVAQRAPEIEEDLDMFDDLADRLARSKPPQYAGGRLGGFAVAAAALAALRGPVRAAPLFEPVAPALARALSELPQTLDKNSLVPADNLLAVLAVARCCGVAVPDAECDVEARWLPQLAASAGLLTEPERHSLALAAVAAGLPALVAPFIDARPSSAPFMPGQVQGFDVTAFAAYLAAAATAKASYDDVEPAWLDFVHRFPVKLDTRMLEWPALLWAARAVYATIGGLDEAEVGVELHRLVVGP